MALYQAGITSREGEHLASVSINGQFHPITIPARENGPGSSVSGGELLLLAVATCYVNDIYREAGHLGIHVEQVEVTVSGSFDAPGVPAAGVSYTARVKADASDEQVLALLKHTDEIAEVHNSLRLGTPVAFKSAEVIHGS